MALVKCPECGKDNVSDSAISCPECGFSIKEHFDEIKQKAIKAKEKADEDNKTKELIDKLHIELEEELNRIDNLTKPEKPNFFNMIKEDKSIYFISLLLFFFVFLIIGIIICENNGASGGVLYAFALINGVLLAAGIYSSVDDYNIKLIDYTKKTEDWDKYKKDEKERIKTTYDYYEKNIIEYGTRTKPLSELQKLILSSKNGNGGVGVPHCPCCGSSNTKNISTTSRLISVATFGLGSSKIGKQKQCKNCGYKF